MADSAAGSDGGAGVNSRRIVRRAWRLTAAFLCGASLNLAFAPFGWWPLAVLAPAALFALLRGLPPRRAGRIGAAFGAGLFLFGTYWLYTALHVFGLVPVWLTLLLQAALIGMMAAFYGAVGVLANGFLVQKSGDARLSLSRESGGGLVGLSQESGARGSLSEESGDAPASSSRDSGGGLVGLSQESGARVWYGARVWLVLPALWVLLEWLRGWVLSGFPWLSLGYALIDSPLKGWAPLFGVYGVSWAAAASAVALNVTLTRALPLRQRLLAVGGAALLFAIPSLLDLHDWTHRSGDLLFVAAVQGAVSQDQKWLAKNLEQTKTRYTDLDSRAWGARLIVWPEAALPAVASDIPDFLRELRAQGAAHGADFVIGLLNYDPDTRQYHNGILALTGAGTAWYYKRHLVPFGEYFPVPAFVRSWMRLLSLPYDDITPGSRHQPAVSAGGQTLGLTICYEDAFGSEQLETLRTATLLVNVTNNAWYGDSTAPPQHLQISRMRALEAGRYLVRAANDGITAVIGPHGDVVDRLPQFQQAVLRVLVQPMTGLTPYARLGNYPVVIGAGLLLAVGVWRRRPGG